MRGGLADGADLVTFSGDKLLGGPQAGFIVGRAELIGASTATRSKRALRRQDPARRARGDAEALPRSRPAAERLPTLRLLRAPKPRSRRGRRAARSSPRRRRRRRGRHEPLREPDRLGRPAARHAAQRRPRDPMPAGRRGPRAAALAAALRSLPGAGDRPHRGRRACPRPALPDDEAGFVANSLAPDCWRRPHASSA